MSEDAPVGWKAIGVTALGATIGAVVGALTSRRGKDAEDGREQPSGSESAQRDEAAAGDATAQATRESQGTQEPEPEQEQEQEQEQDTAGAEETKDARPSEAHAGSERGDVEDEAPPERGESGEAEADDVERDDGESDDTTPHGAGASEPEPDRTAADDEGEPRERAEPEAASESGETGADADDAPQGAPQEPDNGDRGRALADRLRLVASAKEQLAQLTGREPEAVLGLEARDDGHVLTVEVVEFSRMPPSTDIIGLYELHLDGDGAVQRYERTDRYIRGRADDSGGE